MFRLKKVRPRKRRNRCDSEGRSGDSSHVRVLTVGGSVHSGCCTKHHRPGSFIKTDIYFPQLWRPEVQDRGASMVGGPRLCPPVLTRWWGMGGVSLEPASQGPHPTPVTYDLPQAPLPTPSPWRLGFQHRDAGDTNLPTTAFVGLNWTLSLVIQYLPKRIVLQTPEENTEQWDLARRPPRSQFCNPIRNKRGAEMHSLIIVSVIKTFTFALPGILPQPLRHRCFFTPHSVVSVSPTAVIHNNARGCVEFYYPSNMEPESLVLLMQGRRSHA